MVYFCKTKKMSIYLQPCELKIGPPDNQKG